MTSKIPQPRLREEKLSGTLSTTKYSDFYYTELSPTGIVDNIESIVIASSSGNNFVSAQITGVKIRVYGTIAGGSVTIRVYYR